METTSKLSDFENSIYLNKISKSVRDLRSTTDTLLFVRQMLSLSELLSRFHRNLDNSFSAVDENIQDPTYFIAAYFDTENIADALWIYRIVKSLTRYILLSDRFYETGNDRYALFAKRVRKSVSELIQSRERRMLKNYTFSYAEIRHFNLAKSSDASLIYAKVLDAKLPSFNENVALVLHYNQALLDIQDDWEDIEDDVQEDMPNILVMAAVENVPYHRIKKSRRNLIRKVVLSETNSYGGPVSRLVNELQISSNRVSIPENFAFLKFLSDRYADTLKRKISSPNF
jgi:hypothetical protein